MKKGTHHSEESKARLREANTGKWVGNKNPMFGKHPFGVENPMYGRHISEETKAKMREARLGKHQSEETIAKRIAKTKGMKRSEETKTKMREAMIARKLLREKNPNWKGDRITQHSGRDRARSWYPCPKGMERHHIDGNPLNNSPENVMIVTPKEHMELHNRLNHRDSKGRFV